MIGVPFMVFYIANFYSIFLIIIILQRIVYQVMDDLFNEDRVAYYVGERVHFKRDVFFIHLRMVQARDTINKRVQVGRFQI